MILRKKQILGYIFFSSHRSKKSYVRLSKLIVFYCTLFSYYLLYFFQWKSCTKNSLNFPGFPGFSSLQYDIFNKNKMRMKRKGLNLNGVFFKANQNMSTCYSLQESSWSAVMVNSNKELPLGNIYPPNS